MENKTQAFEGALASLGLRYWEYDIKTKRLYRSALVQNEVGYAAYKENVPESYVEEGIIHPDYAQAYLDLYHNLAKGIDGRLVFKTLFGNRTWGWLDISYKVMFDEAGVPVRAVGIGGDVTKEKQQELVHSLTKEQNELLSSVLLTSVAYEFDYLIYINKDTEAFITYSAFHEEEVHTGERFGAVLQKRLCELPPDECEALAKRMSFAVICEELQKRDSYYVPFTWRRADGSLRYKIARFYNVKGNRQYILMTMRDVTDTQLAAEQQNAALQKAKEEAEQANKAKTQFLSNISHDIRTPLNAIINLNEMVKTELDTPKQAMNDLDKISVSGEFLLGLVNDILDISKVESSDTELTATLYPNAEFKQYLESVIRPLCDQKNIWLAFNLNPGNEMILTDRTRFNQIFFNILSNAIKYNHFGGNVSLSSEVLWKTEDKLGMQYTIEDDGIGMSEEFQKKLFQPFAREDTTGQYSGTGLGMNITKAIVEKMGGEISVESKKDVGTKFTVRLVLDLPTEDRMQAYRLEKASAAPSQKESLDILGHGKHVLIAEDHPLNQEILRRLVGKYGIITECVANGKLAVDSFVNHMPHYYDAILMDIRMPILDGLEATRQIRASAKTDAAAVPVIAMSGNAFQDDIQKAKEAGVTEYLTKPIEPAKLEETLVEAFARRTNKETILLVDDVELNRAVLGSALKDEYTLLEASGGKEALALLESNNDIAAVITDLQMPEMDGTELIRRIRANPKFRQVVILANTQYGDPTQEEALLALGADDFIYKPTTPTIVKAKVHKVLQK